MTSTAQVPRGCADPLDVVYDVGLLDLDGVVYLGGAAIPGAAEALRNAEAAGMRLAYVTNNAFRTPAAIADLLTHTAGLSYGMTDDYIGELYRKHVDPAWADRDLTLEAAIGVVGRFSCHSCTATPWTVWVTFA